MAFLYRAKVNKTASVCNELVQTLQLDFMIGDLKNLKPTSHIKLSFGKSAYKVFLWHITFELNNLKNVFPDSKHDSKSTIKEILGED